jgi:hypothetical protein
LRHAQLLVHPRVGLFSLWTSTRAAHGGHTAVSQIFVHSKLLLVDDVRAVVGSANMDGVSLRSYGEDFEGWLGRRVFDGVRNVDLCVVLNADRDGWCGGAITDLRARLWREHLSNDLACEQLHSGTRALAHWRRSAARNVEALNEGRAAPGRVFSYSTRRTPVRQLAEIGVHNTSALDVVFRPGWLEVTFSPNWIRNIL